jgi:CelD/BcsL family acetyltransferase involved in cellulose biosynthesis
MEIVETRTAAALTALQDEWNELLEQCNRATIFQSWEWNEAWWHHLGCDKRLCLLQVRDHGRLVGLAPFCISRYPGTPLRRLMFIGTGVSDYLDVLSSSNRHREVCTAIVQYLATSRNCDLVDLQDLHPTALLREAMQSTALPPPLADTHELMWMDQEASLSIILPPTWEAYSATLGKKVRRNVPYYTRLLQRRCHEVDYGLAGRTELADVMSELFQFHQERWQRRQQHGHFGSQAVQAFHRQVAERFYDRHWLRLRYIRIGGRIIAVDYGFCFRGTFAGYLAGFNPDPEWQPYSVGTIMMAEVIRQAIAEGCQVLDFLRGKEAYKEMWAPTHKAINSRLLLLRRRSPRARTMLWLDQLPSRMTPIVKAKKRLVQLLHKVKDVIVQTAQKDTQNSARAD